MKKILKEKFKDADTNPATAYELGRHDERLLMKEELDRQREEMIEKLEGMKKGLDTDNNKTNLTCNPTCHDSGKESAIDDAIEQIKK